MNRNPSAADVFRAVADPCRRMVLDRLRAGEMPVGELSEGFSGSQPAFSKHIKVLADAGIIRQRRQGRQLMCRLNPAPLAELVEWADLFRSLWMQKLDHLENYLDSKHGKKHTN